MDASTHDGRGGIVGKRHGRVCQFYTAIRDRNFLGSGMADSHAGYVFFRSMGKSTGKVVEIPTLIITLASLSVTALGAFFVYRQTSLTFIKSERDDYRQKASECEQSMRSLMRDNRWLLNRLSQYEDTGQRWRSQHSEDPEKGGGK
jgi:hypothetical protein